jgi:hypothetical protein
VTLTARNTGLLAIAFAAVLSGRVVTEGQSVLLFEFCAAAAAVILAVAAARRPAVGIPAIAFLLAAFPLARVVVHGAPIYATDVLAFLLLVGAIKLRSASSGYGSLVVVYLASWTLAWVHEVASLNLILTPTYGLLRNLVAVAVFFPAYFFARRQGADPRFVFALAGGATVTASLALLQAAAPGPANSLLRALAPNFTSSALEVYPDRAFALFGAPTTLCGFLAFAIPLFIASAEFVRRRQRVLLAIATVLCLLAALATYSRQWVPALAAGLIVLAVLRLRTTKQMVITAAVVLVLAWTAFASGALNQSYLGERFNSLSTQDANVQSRLTRQKAFIGLAWHDPATFFIGKGFAGQDLVARNLVSANTAERLREGLSDNVFLLEVFNHGLIAGLLYLGLFLTALKRILLSAATRRTSDSALLAGVGAALVVALVLQLSDNYFSESVFMKTLLWLLIGTGVGLVDRERGVER